jgi:hemerythrin
LKTFLWNQHFETGLVTVDDQHRRLVALINRLGDSFVESGAGTGSSLQSVFDDLAQYTVEHFGDEERLMLAERLVPEYIAAHRAIHDEFAAQLHLMWDTRATVSESQETLLGFLIAWLSFHILGEDQAMAIQIEAVRKGSTPEEAYSQIEKLHQEDGRTRALIDALQGLYHTLSLRNRELADANARLERRVIERTHALSESNAALQKAQEVLEQLARLDSLLGIANRRQFDERLEMEWKRAYRGRTPLALLMIDVDHFKRYNDTYGHQAGDECLKAVATAIGGGKRAVDLFARYGGEEFVLLLPNTPLSGAGKIANDALKAVEFAAIAHGDSPVASHVTVSIGVACRTPDKSTRSEVLIAAADRALYSAKDTGRNRIVLEATA